jgi:sec-independent protein translocase protein TatA
LLSPPDIAVIGALALIFFGPDQLPKIARQAGKVVRDVQNTSHSFIREMERAADDLEFKEAFEKKPEMTGPRPESERLAEPAPAIVQQAPRTHATAASENFVPGPPAPPAPPAHEIADDAAFGI